jgi:hypothetical protein
LGSSGWLIYITIDAPSNYFRGQQSGVAHATPSHSRSKYPPTIVFSPSRFPVFSSQENAPQFTVEVDWFDYCSGGNEYVGQDDETSNTEEDWYELPDTSEDANHTQ